MSMNGFEWNFAEFEAGNLNKSELGLLLLCEARNDGDTRLFISQFSFLMDDFTKNGWWDTFTISKEPCKKGFYLCTIEEFRIDRNGYLNVVVKPSRFLETFIEENKESDAWDFLFRSNMFSTRYARRMSCGLLNVDALIEKYEEEFKRSELYLNSKPDEIKFFSTSLFAKYLLEQYLINEITLEEIAIELKKPPYVETLAREILCVIRTNSSKFDEYPLLKKKFPTDKMFVTELVDWLERKSMEFDTLRLGDGNSPEYFVVKEQNKNELFERIETVLAYWEDKKALEKAAKKQKRLDSKNK